jgi:hypothetical protein
MVPILRILRGGTFANVRILRTTGKLLFLHCSPLGPAECAMNNDAFGCYVLRNKSESAYEPRHNPA